MTTSKATYLKSWRFWLVTIGLVLLVAVPRLTALNRYRIVDEADRWRWAENFVLALNDGDLAATRVGDGYPGIVPVWAESIWVFLEAVRRSVVEGGWIGDPGLYKLFHEWDRTAYLVQQRLPVVLLNTALALAVIWAVWRLFGGRVALLGGLLIALDPFYLSDSRVNRAEALITGLMTLSMLSLIFYARKRQFRYVIISGIFGGLSFLTKIQALAMLPAIALTGLWIYFDDARSGRLWPPRRENVWRLIWLGVGWAVAAAVTWVVLWPSMWVTPLETLSLVYNYATHKVGAEGVKLFFMGETFEDTDPGPIFYPLVFLLRTSPLTLLGLVGAALLSWRWRKNPPGDRPTTRGSAILVIYVVVYALAMNAGSHKQDRYLMPIFLSLDILAAIGLVFVWIWLKEWLGVGSREKGVRGVREKPPTPYSLLLTPSFMGGALLAAVVAIQLAIIWPHHPYYYSYFNPLFGGGKTAIKVMRIGWGEGMDQAGAYLAAKPNADRLVVSSRFTHNMLGFPGELIALGADGRWTRADYIVLYIQQVQRRLEPSPEFLDYFQARQPEKVIRLGDIDYVWIYPIPFSVPANPQISQIPDRAALFGYSWEANERIANGESTPSPPHIRLLWKNLGIKANQTLAARLTGPTVQTGWAVCQPDANFTQQAHTPPAFVESLCRPNIDDLPPGVYTVEFGLAPANNLAGAEAFVFPRGWDAARISESGDVQDTTAQEQLDALAAEAVPATATRLDRVYEAQIRLVAYQLAPAQPHPGDTLQLTLYWQAVQDINESANLTVQLADSRLISLGRDDQPLHQFVKRGPARFQWFPGQVKTTQHRFKLSPELDSPLAGRIEIILRNDADVALKPTTAAGKPLNDLATRFTVAPERWPSPSAIQPAAAQWQHGIQLLGYTLSPARARAGQQLDVNLYWQTAQPLSEDYVAFVHLVDEQGQLHAQNDAVPRLGAYPTPWWLPGVVIKDEHPLALPPDLPPGRYQMLAGLYRSADGVRLPLAQGGDITPLGQIDVLPPANGDVE